MLCIACSQDKSRVGEERQVGLDGPHQQQQRHQRLGEFADAGWEWIRRNPRVRPWDGHPSLSIP